MRGALYTDGAGATLDSFECVFDLEDVAVGGEDWRVSVEWWMGKAGGMGWGLAYRRGRGRSLLMPCLGNETGSDLYELQNSGMGRGCGG